ncbi:MAG: DNA mismatch repair protein MutS [Salibacteraceae bacterium]
MATKKKYAETPLMKQYNTIKAKYPDALLLFRVGDFYETFGEDAIKASGILGIVLTKRANGKASHIELAGFPHHSMDTYLPKLVRAGERVAICDQLEDPKKSKTIVKRGVTELVTPGVSYNDKILEQKNNNFLASVFIDRKSAGVSFLDISTGQFYVAEGSIEYVDKLLQSFSPSEVLFSRNKKASFETSFGDKFHTYFMEDWAFKSDFANEQLLNHFGTNSLKGFGIDEMELGIIAAGAVLYYLSDTQHNRIKHITQISRIDQSNHVWLDRFTIRNLELFHSPHTGGKALIDVIDKTVSPMGARMLKRWLALPLKEKVAIDARHSIVDWLLKHDDESLILTQKIKSIGDLERLISKAAIGRIHPREVKQLLSGLNEVPDIKELFLNSGNEHMVVLGDQLNPCESLKKRINKELSEDPPVLVSKGNVIREGVSAELDDLRKLQSSGKNYLIEIQERESKATGITSLKIGFNNVFGYYLEVTNAHKDKVPIEWSRKQTLTGSERYITEELKEYESKILGAGEKILALETKLYESLVLSISEFIRPIQLDSELIGKIDCLLSFATSANENFYTKPKIHEGYSLAIQDGRHPVIETQLKLGEAYVTNDLFVDNEKQQVLMITGPNMVGKSAYLRQNALIVLLAQMGSFVPAKNAEIGLVDRIFTRVGASDNISQGESTFMVEMNETASILNNISDRSLVILDEIGRGTSTYDGISIAWSITEYLHAHKMRPKTLFATHYHELNEMSNSFDRIKNYNFSIKELNKKIIFLRKLIPGGSEHSFGIHVAKMAGMPAAVINKANKILVDLEKSSKTKKANKEVLKNQESDLQLSIFQLDDPTLSQIKDELIKVDINTLTPVEALMKLNEIKSLIQG